MMLRHIRIGTRLAAGFGSVLAILALLLVIANLLQSRNKQHLLEGMMLASDKMVLADGMKSAMLEAGIAMRNIGLLNEVMAMQQQEDQVRIYRAHYGKLRDRLAAMALSAHERALLADVARLDKALQQPLLEAMSRALAFDQEGAALVLSGRVAPLNQAAVAQIGKLETLQAEAQRAFIAQSARQDRWLNGILLGLSGATLLAAAVLAWRITRSITIPLDYAVAVSHRAAQGDLSAVAHDAGRDEVGHLFSTLARMNASLGDIVGQVRSGARIMLQAAADIAAGNAELSARTETQAGSLEETASAMEQLTVAVGQNAANVEEAYRLAASASARAEGGGQLVRRITATMQVLRGQSTQIASIIGVIDSLAFQTNILALNAAVEAARAGPHGRGFAVVASEVRILAQRSAEAAREISQLIKASVGSIHSSGELVSEAGSVMDDIIGSVQRVTHIMGDISQASNEQSNGIQEINRAVAQMDELTQQNAAMVEEAAAASQNLEELARAMVGAVSVFTLAAPAARLH